MLIWDTKRVRIPAVICPAPSARSVYLILKSAYLLRTRSAFSINAVSAFFWFFFAKILPDQKISTVRLSTLLLLLQLTVRPTAPCTLTIPFVTSTTGSTPTPAGWPTTTRSWRTEGRVSEIVVTVAKFAEWTGRLTGPSVQLGLILWRLTTRGGVLPLVWLRMEWDSSATTCSASSCRRKTVWVCTTGCSKSKNQ